MWLNGATHLAAPARLGGGDAAALPPPLHHFPGGRAGVHLAVVGVQPDGAAPDKKRPETAGPGISCVRIIMVEAALLLGTDPSVQPGIMSSAKPAAASPTPTYVPSHRDIP